MVRLTFYGGVNEIGGNKILLEDGDRRLLLDFGFPYKRHKLFYEEYLKPRPGAGLLDPLAMGLLPLVEGIYRDDVEAADLWPRFREAPQYRKLDGVDGVLLSHAHLDHSGHISFLRHDIPVYSTGVTAFVAKAIQDSGRADFDQQVCYFSPRERRCPTGLRQEALISRRAPKQQRRFCIGDIGPGTLGAAAAEFWEQGFWDKGPKQEEEIKSQPVAGVDGCAFGLRCLPVDHSIPGACAWCIETGAGWLVYSGDLRLHGKRAGLSRKFMEEAAGLRPRALILEGTNVQREANVSELEVYRHGLKAVRSADGLVVADFAARDVDRLLTFLQIARETGRRLAVLPRDAYLLKTMRLLEPDTPDIAREEGLAIYQDTTASKNPSLWLRNLCQEYDSKLVLARDVDSAQGEFILAFSFFDLNELPSIRPRPGSLYVYSSSEPHDEEQEIDFRRLHNWLEHFGFRSFGLPVESADGWQVPEGEAGLHASGHACGPDLLEVAREIGPELLIPVHSEHPEYYLDSLGGRRTEVLLPTAGGTIEV